MLSFFQKNKSSKKHQHQQTHQSTNALPTSPAEIKASTFSEVKQSLGAALSGRLKHKGSAKSINIDYVDYQSGSQTINQTETATPPTTKFNLLRKKSSESFLAKLSAEAEQQKKLAVKDLPVKETVATPVEGCSLPKAKAARFINKSHIPFMNSGYFTVGRGKKPAPSLGD
jgi:DNA repair exonuclease SbcCD nuclease subunit